jgi:hypothetical protein
MITNHTRHASATSYRAEMMLKVEAVQCIVYEYSTVYSAVYRVLYLKVEAVQRIVYEYSTVYSAVYSV